MNTRAPTARIEWLAGYELIVVAYVAATLVLGQLFGFTLDFSRMFDLMLDMTFLGLTWLGLVVVLLYTGVRARRTELDHRAFGACWRRRVRAEYVTPQRAYDLLKTLVLIKVVLVSYGTIKLAIPYIHPGLHDQQLLRVDRWLHGGLDPSALSVGLLGQPAITRAIDVLYVGWYFVKVLTLVVFVLVADRRLHAQFFGAYYSLWILGGLAAVWLPSLGPAYVQPELFASLNRPYAAALQQHLTQHYAMAADHSACSTLIYEGTAAFPSLHVAVVALFALFLRRVSTPLAIFMALYTVVTQIGAVHLGWHYAVDGYVGVLLAVGLYACFTRLLRPQRAPVRSAPNPAGPDSEWPDPQPVAEQRLG